MNKFLRYTRSKWFWITLISLNVGVLTANAIIERGFQSTMILNIVSISIVLICWYLVHEIAKRFPLED